MKATHSTPLIVLAARTSMVLPSLKFCAYAASSTKIWRGPTPFRSSLLAVEKTSPHSVDRRDTRHLYWSFHQPRLLMIGIQIIYNCLTPLSLASVLQFRQPPTSCLPIMLRTAYILCTCIAGYFSTRLLASTQMARQSRTSKNSTTHLLRCTGLSSPSSSTTRLFVS